MLKRIQNFSFHGDEASNFPPFVILIQKWKKTPLCNGIKILRNEPTWREASGLALAHVVEPRTQFPVRTLLRIALIGRAV